MPYIPVRGVEHYYEWIGTDRPTGSKPVMVFIHGWGGSSRYWESTARALADRFDCLLYDLRGFGRSRPLTAPDSSEATLADPRAQLEALYDLETYAEDLAGLLDALGLDRVDLNSHSMGASVATLFLNRYGDRVRRAILTCSGIFEYDEPAFSAFHKWGGQVVKFRPLWLAKIPFVDRLFMARFLHRSIPTALQRAFLEDFLIADYEAALGTIYTSVSKKATEVMPREFARLQVPVLLVAGQYDRIIPAAMGREAANLSDRIDFVEISKTAHFPMLEDPQTYLQRVTEFLESASPA
ncbi:alpha/beta fold hydrolase [Oxynema aestuarii]|jgi:pimeloyl-ACP methyl ester carboxylesterase|uniref:Alpha/beta hydrolase n=1 Tax=Oxynema aestuarii AP17 TaxID=2064643 RepID=A0A6H1TZK0_9CYAN|nr:alpha/beta hydrolase [Oxynema aestuarii]QIZ72032.1 alpha/beta hydrolase [Oxynema aestuarii AP17]